MKDELEFGKAVFFGIHSGVLVGIIPFGFSLIGFRFLNLFIQSLVNSKQRKLMGILASVGITTIALMGAPLFIVMGLAALVAFQLSGEPVTAVPIELYRIADAPTLLTIPLFTFAGYMIWLKIS